MRIGHGYDVHRLIENRKLVLGGVTIPFPFGLLGHSDADVVVHAIMDSILGALGLGDIGTHFPDTEKKYQGISSLKLAETTALLLKEQGYVIGNIDATFVAQKPKLAPYIAEMRQNIAQVYDIALNQVNIKATTEEGLGFTGKGEAIAAHAVCLLLP